MTPDHKLLSEPTVIVGAKHDVILFKYRFQQFGHEPRALRLGIEGEGTPVPAVIFPGKVLQDTVSVIANLDHSVGDMNVVSRTIFEYKE